MSGVAFCMSACFGCRRLFAYNPVRVPSIRDPHTNSREPVCPNCMAWINAQRQQRGLEPFQVAPDAYEACDESEVP